jgi:hypothetical protein
MRRSTVNAPRLCVALAVAVASIAANPPTASADDEVVVPNDPTDVGTSTTSSTSTTISPTTTTVATPRPTAPPLPATTAAATTTTSTTDTTITIATVPAPAPRNITAYPSQIANILATIRYMESRGNYTAPPNKGRASGAYQFITSTWNNYAGYRDAYLAPPAIQDERAAADVTKFLAQWNNDVSMIPVMWYLPSAARYVERMDIVPVPTAGNVLTVREYQQRWLAVWATMSGRPIPPSVGFGFSGLPSGSAPGSAPGLTPGLVPGRAISLSIDDQLARMGLAPEVPADTIASHTAPPDERLARVAFPVLGPTRVAAPHCGDAQEVLPGDPPPLGGDAIAAAGASRAETEAAGLCAQAAPGIVFGVKLQPVLAVVDGVITDVRNELGEVISVTITNAVGRSFHLEGFNDDNPGTDDGAAPEHLRLTRLAAVGQSVRAGQILGFVGNSSPLPLGIRSDLPTDATVAIPTDAVAPHIRLTITDLDATPVDAYGPVIDAVFRQACSVGIGPWSSRPTDAGAHQPITIESTDDSEAIDSEWVITASGEVNASGWAAMIYPSEACGWAPLDKRGPGAGGPTATSDSWHTPIKLYTPIWVELAVRSNEWLPTRLLRP